ncbi:endoribonuclease L-PSP family protein [Cadophora sp. DSE1049]|nr:endoribonuclease L-PSP family protein [Cadophora sp. DSE1049]
MKAATYVQVPGPLGDYYEATGFSHAVVLPVGARLVITSGQPGLNSEARMSASPAEQLEATFDNCDKALKAAGVSDGLWKAHKIHCFLIDTSLEPLLMEIWRRKWAGHRPTWMTVGTSSLCGKGMIVEIQVEAHIVPDKHAL